MGFEKVTVRVSRLRDISLYEMMTRFLCVRSRLGECFLRHRGEEYRLIKSWKFKIESTEEEPLLQGFMEEISS